VNLTKEVKDIFDMGYIPCQKAKDIEDYKKIKSVRILENNTQIFYTENYIEFLDFLIETYKNCYVAKDISYISCSNVYVLKDNKLVYTKLKLILTFHKKRKNKSKKCNNNEIDKNHLNVKGQKNYGKWG